MCVVVEGVLWAEEVLVDRKAAWCSLVILQDIVTRCLMDCTVRVIKNVTLTQN